ncbi:MAG: preprotein translocase subunit SecY [Planctomycetes bacterium]|nr:preprotein translocase subunit SecY [Planctomycetota bacterium]
MIAPIIHIWKSRELRNKTLFVLGMLAIFRVAATIPIPGIDTTQLAAFFSGNQFFGLLNIFSGGALSNLSLMMLGLGPYITSTIILQLLTMIFPQLKEMYQESGEQGRQKFNQYGRMLTVPLAALQGYGLITLFTRQGVLAPLGLFDLITTLAGVVAGAIFLMWLGEMISEKGIGNGISILIFAGIIASVPSSIGQLILTGFIAQIPTYVVFVILAVVVVSGVIIVNEARRNIIVSYAKQVRGNKMYGGVSTFLPLSLNPAGVIPIIFALSMLLFPSMVGSFLVDSGGFLGGLAGLMTSFSQSTLAYSAAYFTLVVLFTYFYTAVTFDPKSIATNLQKQGGFIPGIRPGPPTAGYLTHILNRLLIVGAMFLGLIAILPSLVQGTSFLGGGISQGGISFLIGGTAVLIVVSVVLETMRQFRAQLAMREYET